MGQKDFTDWNGQKRKNVLQPPRERDVRYSSLSRSQKPIGFKTKLDRFQAALKDLEREHYYLREHIRSQGRNGFWLFGRNWVKRTFKRLRKMKEEYVKEGIYNKIRDSVKASSSHRLAA